MDKEDILNNTTTQGACLLWNGRPDKDGYGSVWFEGKKRSTHKVAFYLRHGNWPGPDEVVHHECRNKLCMNADHLKTVLRRKHVLEHKDTCVTMRNAEKTQCQNGHPFTSENTYYTKSGSRGCIICRREYKRGYTTTPEYRESRNSKDRDRRRRT